MRCCMLTHKYLLSAVLSGRIVRIAHACVTVYKYAPLSCQCCWGNDLTQFRAQGKTDGRKLQAEHVSMPCGMPGLQRRCPQVCIVTLLPDSPCSSTNLGSKQCPRPVQGPVSTDVLFPRVTIRGFEHCQARLQGSKHRVIMSPCSTERHACRYHPILTASPALSIG